MELLLNQKEADRLISLLKVYFKNYSLELENGSNEKILIKANENNRMFTLFIHYENENYHLNFMDNSTKLNLVRINLNNSFHKNANGEIVRGNRVNIFCEDEFNQRKDGQYMRAYKLPYKNILKDPKDFSEAMYDLLAYTNIISGKHKLQLVPKII